MTLVESRSSGIATCPTCGGALAYTDDPLTVECLRCDRRGRIEEVATDV